MKGSDNTRRRPFYAIAKAAGERSLRLETIDKLAPVLGLRLSTHPVGRAQER